MIEGWREAQVYKPIAQSGIVYIRNRGNAIVTVSKSKGQYYDRPDYVGGPQRKHGDIHGNV